MSQLMPPDIAPDLQGQPPQTDIHSHSSQSQSTLSSSSQASQTRPDPNLDPNLSGDHVQSVLAQPTGQPAPPGLHLGTLDSTQILALLRHLPGVFNKLAEHGGIKESAAEQLQQHLAGGRPLPGPSSNFTFTTANPPSELPAPVVVPQENGKTPKRKRGKAQGNGEDGDAEDIEDWTRQRKDNHKEVERRRRGNINEGINELARIVPNGSGEKAKGAILNRAVQYIHHLKENEARNIEKWTLEKLLMDQAMGDLQAQLEEVRRLWDEERQAKERALLELDVIRSGGAGSGSVPNTQSNPYERRVAEDGNDPRDRAYHPSDRHHHIQRSPDIIRDPDVAVEGNADHEADGEHEEQDAEGERDDERADKRRRVI